MSGISPSEIFLEQTCVPDPEYKDIQSELSHPEKRYTSKVTFLIKNSFIFFSKRLEVRDKTFVSVLEKYLKQLKESNIILDTYHIILEEIYYNVDNKANWDKFEDLDLDNQIELWCYRECIVAITLYTTYLLSIKFEEINIIDDRYRNLYTEDCTASILGSNTLISDIDVTISADHGSSFISVIEDLLVSLEWFNSDKWKIDFYGDFMLVGEYYIDTHHFSKTIKAEMLELAVQSYFRHSDSNLFDLTVLNKLLNWCIQTKELNIDVNMLLKIGNKKINSVDREFYYEYLSKAEHMEEKTIDIIESSNCTNSKISNLFGEVIIALGKANLYRNENYILTSTTTHIVKIEQAKEIATDHCNPLLTKVAKCSLSKYAYVLSAIEQLGYLQYKVISSAKSCSLGANKYFGRFVRAIKEVPELISDIKIYNQCLKITDILDKEKTKRSEKNNLNQDCTTDINLYVLANKLIK
jgi:hypothetical protein